MDYNVTILMAVYNGSKFIEEQINSIINQSYCNWKLIIRDDKSTDDTKFIVEKYCKKDNRITYIYGKENLGQVMNFNELMKTSLDSEYIMFCDQDDVWLPNKIENTINRMLEVENDKGKNEPILVYSDLKYVDENLKPLDAKKVDISPKPLESLLGFNYIWGCTMMLNKALINMAYPISKKTQNHDYWIALHAQLKGTIEYLSEETMFYRQHSNNVTGGINNYSFKSKMKKTGKMYDVYDVQIEQNLEFCKKYKNEKNQVLLRYNNIFSNGKITSVIKAIKFNLKRPSWKDTLLFYTYLVFRQ